VISPAQMSDGELLAELAARLRRAAPEGEAGLRLTETTVEDRAEGKAPTRARRSRSR